MICWFPSKSCGAARRRPAFSGAESPQTARSDSSEVSNDSINEPTNPRNIAVRDYAITRANEPKKARAPIAILPVVSEKDVAIIVSEKDLSVGVLGKRSNEYLTLCTAL